MKVEAMLVSQVNYEQILLAEEHELVSEEACAAYLFALKWPNGFVCPECRHCKAYTIATRRLPLFECVKCSFQASLTSGTIMERSRTPLVKWFAAIRFMSSMDNGISALALSRELKLTYKTAWTMLHRIRTAMASEELDFPLEGEVAIHNDTYASPWYHGSLSPHPRESRVIVGATLSKAGEPERVTIQTVEKVHWNSWRFNRSAIRHFMETRMDWKARLVYCPINFYTSPRHKKRLSVMKDAARWLNNTFHGIGKKYLQTYLLEFCCRVNLSLAGRPAFHAISKICTSTRASG
jgi:Zn ribbon nucleic-acid-binding protein